MWVGVGVAEKAKEARLRLYGHVIKADVRELVREIKNEDITRRIGWKERLKLYTHVIRRDTAELVRDIKSEEIRRCGMVDIAEKMREARLRWYGHVIRRDEGELVRDIMKVDIQEN